MEKESSNIIWNIFSSLKLTLVLLIILAITSILGTLIPQQDAAANFAKALNPDMFQFFNALQLFDMYHSVWFRLIIGALALNLIICSFDRLPATLRRFQTLPRPDRSKPFQNLPAHREISVKGKVQDVAEKVSGLMKDRYGKVTEKRSDKGHFFYGEKGRYNLFGVYVVHISVLVILVGAIIGSLFGFKAFVNITEGETKEIVTLQKSRSPKKLGFSVRCEKFFVDFYDNGTPKEYRSELSFIVGGDMVKRGSLEVNHPVTFMGITFYQSSYGPVPSKKVSLRISKKGGSLEDTIHVVELNRPFPLPDKDGEFLVKDIRDNYMKMGPAVQIMVKPLEGEGISLWLFKRQDMINKRFPGLIKRFPKLNPSAYEPYTFHLDEIKNMYFTGLQVNRDPGVPFVWAGFFLIMIGFFITFFMSHRRIWVRVSKGSKDIGIRVAGMANKNPVELDKELDQLSEKLRNLF